MESPRTILITGGAGFIGSHLVRHFVKKYPDYQIVNLDALTYAGNLGNLIDIEGASNYTFIKGQIEDTAFLERLFRKFPIDGVIHLAAESHVDRSISDPMAFIRTNVFGTVELMNAARKAWEGRDDTRFYHVSTDEVYGSLGKTGLFTEKTAYDPRSPYSASKASSDHFVRAYFHTYDFPVVISNCSNNYGPYQFPEKLIPLFINNIVQEKALPVYGDGAYTRDWLWVGDHVEAIDLIFHAGKVGETYNVGGENEWQNIDLIRLLCGIMDEFLQRPLSSSGNLITFVPDRPGHDRRYAIDPTKIKEELGWSPKVNFENGLRETVAWYLANAEWLKSVTSGSYLEYYEKQYQTR